MNILNVIVPCIMLKLVYGDKLYEEQCEKDDNGDFRIQELNNNLDSLQIKLDETEAKFKSLNSKKIKLDIQ